MKIKVNKDTYIALEICSKQLQSLINLENGKADGGDGITDNDWIAAEMAVHNLKQSE